MAAADAKAGLKTNADGNNTPAAPVNKQNEGPVMPRPTPAELAAKAREAVRAEGVKTKRSVAEVVAAWAAGLIPKNAPDARNKGPLAWVREVEAAKLIEALEKEGYK